VSRRSNATIAELKAGYAAAAASHGRATRSGDWRTANKQYDLVTTIRRHLLARGSEGERAIGELLTDTDPAVRCWAACHGLFFAHVEAERTLMALAAGPPSPERLNAEMTLREWRAGRLRPIT